MCERLKRIRQCSKCPWKKSTNPYDIPHDYSVDKHNALASTIANPESLAFTNVLRVMSCHEHDTMDEVMCVGWIHNQIGVGNNIGLRMRLRNCVNLSSLTVVGEQRQQFKDTLPRFTDDKVKRMLKKLSDEQLVRFRDEITSGTLS